MDEPIIDLQSDHYFMGEALRQAAAGLRGGRDAGGRGDRAGWPHYRPRIQSGRTAQGRHRPRGNAGLDPGRGGGGRLAIDRLHTVCDEGTVPDVRGGNGACAPGAGGLWRGRSESRRGRRRRSTSAISRASTINARSRAACARRNAAPSCRSFSPNREKAGPRPAALISSPRSRTLFRSAHCGRSLGPADQGPVCRRSGIDSDDTRGPT